MESFNHRDASTDLILSNLDLAVFFFFWWPVLQNNKCIKCHAAACVPVAQWLGHCVSSAKVVGSIPREQTY